MKGVIVGCDREFEWLLPWWWDHYSVHNSYPVAFADFGLSKEGVEWCRKRGILLMLPQGDFTVSLEKDVSPQQRELWELHYGKKFWIRREQWFKKPFAVLHSPFSSGIWVDLDCQVNGDLEPLFHCLNLGADMAVARDKDQGHYFLHPGEVNYNSGVVAFRKDAKILEQWAEAALSFEDQLPGDQEVLSRAIFLHKPFIIELPRVYNWDRAYGPNTEALIYHYCGGAGKVEILQKLIPDTSKIEDADMLRWLAWKKADRLSQTNE